MHTKPSHFHKRIVIVFTVLNLLMFLGFPSEIIANNRPPQKVNEDNVPKLCQTIELIERVVFVSLAVGGIASFIMILYGGFQLLTAGSNEAQFSAAKGTVTWAAIGLALFASVIFVLLIIQQFTGAQVLNLTTPWIGTITKPTYCP